MPTLTSPAKYQDGVVIPEIKPDFEPLEVVVTFVNEKTQSTRPKGNTHEVLKALDKIKGLLPKDMDGVEYENKIRQETEDHLKRLEW